jgi:hypothetical protein
MVLVANRFIRLIFRGVSGGSDPIIFVNRSCCICNTYKIIHPEIGGNFKIASGGVHFTRTNDITLSQNSARPNWSMPRSQ